MELASVRIITDNLDRMGAFYQRMTGITAERPAPVFAEFVSPLATLAIGHTQTMAAFGDASARPAANHSAILEFRVEDVDAEFERLRPHVESWVQKPTTMPWRNRSILFRDPDGNLVNLFAPATEDAIARFAGRPTAVD
jgi:catechol 2,3-dioxygenase-like lactoylglutathione lyase family enzyme